MRRRFRSGRGDRDSKVGLAPNGKPYESVWDFPRPPAVELVEWRIRVRHADVTIVDAPRCVRVLETSQPPAYYVDPQFVDQAVFSATDRHSSCEWKGVADYVDVHAGSAVVHQSAWTYRIPTDRFAPLAGFWAFYAQQFDECWVDNEQVTSNEGQFYGGWITANVTGPFKGAPGTLHW
jgi:uncharacterized protein (DUF427 family)